LHSRQPVFLGINYTPVYPKAKDAVHIQKEKITKTQFFDAFSSFFRIVLLFYPIKHMVVTT